MLSKAKGKRSQRLTIPINIKIPIPFRIICIQNLNKLFNIIATIIINPLLKWRQKRWLEVHCPYIRRLEKIDSICDLQSINSSKIFDQCENIIQKLFTDRIAVKEEKRWADERLKHLIVKLNRRFHTNEEKMNWSNDWKKENTNGDGGKSINACHGVHLIEPFINWKRIWYCRVID